jgi:hypothetical protein
LKRFILLIIIKNIYKQLIHFSYWYKENQNVFN